MTAYTHRSLTANQVRGREEEKKRERERKDRSNKRDRDHIYLLSCYTNFLRRTGVETALLLHILTSMCVSVDVVSYDQRRLLACVYVFVFTCVGVLTIKCTVRLE